MKNQALFSSKDKSKKLKCHLLQFLFGALRVERQVLIFEIVLYGKTHVLLPKKYITDDNISIFYVCMVWMKKSVTRVTNRHHEAS